jgi:hypothetical protein
MIAFIGVVFSVAAIVLVIRAQPPDQCRHVHK